MLQCICFNFQSMQVTLVTDSLPKAQTTSRQQTPAAAVGQGTLRSSPAKSADVFKTNRPDVRPPVVSSVAKPPEPTQSWNNTRQASAVTVHRPAQAPANKSASNVDTIKKQLPNRNQDASQAQKSAAAAKVAGRGTVNANRENSATRKDYPKTRNPFEDPDKSTNPFDEPSPDYPKEYNPFD